MSDDLWRSGAGDQDPDDVDDDFGPLEFDDDADAAGGDTGDARAASEAPLSFGPNDTGPLPHWTDPPTGELPRLFGDEPATESAVTAGSGDDVDVWSGFSSSRTAWDDDDLADFDLTGEDAAVVASSGASSGDLDATTGELPRRFADDEGYLDPDQSDVLAAVPPRRRGPGRISIGTTPDDVVGRPTAGGRARRQSPARRPSDGRDMPTAVGVGVGIAVVFIAALLWKPIAVLAIVVLVVGLAAVEYFDKVTEKGYRPATIAGITASVSAPLAAYWVGVDGLPIVIALAFLAAVVTFIGADGLHVAPMPNAAITTLGVVWVGFMGAFAALIVDYSNTPGLSNVGTDTLFLVALGVVANDVGALFVGSSTGRTPLRPWISPNKSVEGLVGGAVLTIVAVWLVSLQSSTWNGTGEALLLGVVIAVFAPIGDLTESMFKRNLDVKDFGTLVRGHGGVLDRFDGFLLVLPAAYYLLRILEPWTS